MFGELNESEIEKFLHKELIGRIGCHADGQTYVVPVSYAYDGEYIYCHTQEGMKIRIMRKNPDVCFEVDTMENMGLWNSVISWGKFEEITDISERDKALKILLSRVFPFISSKKMQLGANWPFLPDDTENIKGIVFKIKLGTKTGRFEAHDNLERAPFA